MNKDSSFKAYVYKWPDGKKQIIQKRLSRVMVSSLYLKEIPVLVIPLTKKAGTPTGDTLLANKV